MSLTSRLSAALAASALCIAVVPAVATSPDPASVVVSFRDPDNFSDVDRDPVPRQAWLDGFAAHIERRGAAVVPVGDRLLVTITDIQRAGLVKPGPLGSFHDIRIVRDDTPPRVDLSFKLVTADGKVVKEGQRQLHDIDFLFNSRFHAGDSSDHEKILVDDWLRQEFRPQQP